MIKAVDLDVLTSRAPTTSKQHKVQIRSVVDANRTVIDEIHKAAARKHLAHPLTDGITGEDAMLTPGQSAVKGSENPELLKINLLATQILDRAATLILVDAALASADKDGERLVASIDTLHRICHHMCESRILLSQNYSRSIADRTIKVLLGILQQPEISLSEQQLVKLGELASNFEADFQVIDLSFTVTSFKDVVQRNYTDDGNGSGQLRDPRTGKIVPGVASRKEILAFGEKLYATAQEEINRSAFELKHFKTFNELKTHSESPKYALLIGMFPEVFGAYCGKEILLLRVAALRTAIAVELYYHKENKWPQQLTDLETSQTESLPEDRFAEQWLGYRLNVLGKPMIFSCGPDRDHEPSPTEFIASSSWLRGWHAQLMLGTTPQNGDWLLWQKSVDPQK